jgi:hypothetical protein
MIEMNEAEELSQEIVTAQTFRVARRSSKILKIAAGALAASAVVRGWLNATIDQNEFYGGPKVDFPLKWKIQQFLNSSFGDFGWAALILAAAYAIEIIGLRSARPPEPSELPASKPAATPANPVGPVNFAARPAPSPTAPIPMTTTAAPVGPPPMKIANDEIWRR